MEPHTRYTPGGLILKLTRLWLPLAIAVAGVVLIVIGHGRYSDLANSRSLESAAGVALLLVALIVWMVNWMFRLSVRSNLDREDLEATLRPELLDRVDEIVVFAELGEREIEQVVQLQVALLAERLGAHAMQLDLSEPARRFLAAESSAQGSGARYVARAIARHVTTPLSEAILRGRLATGNTARVDYDGSAITVEAAA